MRKESIYIKLLEYGHKNAEGFTYDEITQWANKNLNDYEQKIVEKYIQNAHENYQRSQAGNIETVFAIINFAGSDYKNKNHKYSLSLDANFKYIDFLELEEARKSSGQANNKALIAIYIAVGTLIISTLLTIWQINSPIKIHSEQFNKILNSFNK
ncbi:MAG: hypothetical protein WC465_03130 [Patescibacteria group bacterium]